MVKIVCIGDSIVEGEGDEMGLSGWAGRLQHKVLESSKVGENRVYNLGMGMETSVDLMHRFFSEVLYRDPDVIIMQAAHGDSRLMKSGSGREEFEIGKKARLRAYDKLFRYLSGSGKKVLIVGLNPVYVGGSFEEDAVKRAAHAESHNKGLKRLCREFGLAFLDPRDVFVDVDLKDYYVDSIHPNSRGYEKMFDFIYSRLVELGYL